MKGGVKTKRKSTSPKKVPRVATTQPRVMSKAQFKTHLNKKWKEINKNIDDTYKLIENAEDAEIMTPHQAAKALVSTTSRIRKRLIAGEKLSQAMQPMIRQELV